MQVPFLDLAAHHTPLRAEFRAAMDAVIDRNAFAGGPFVEQFEREFAAYCGTRHALGVSNGTDALWLALLACGVGPGDEVITVPMTFMATAEAITYTGAKPVFVDIEELTYTLDPRQLEAAITPRTKAIVPVHLFGQTADLDAVLAIADRHGIPVIEDACQAHGATYRGRRAGSLGRAGCFSFYPGKNLGAFGEAGAIVTNDDALADMVRGLRDHGQTRKYHHRWIGWNSRMDGLQAAVLQVKLKYLDQNNAARRAHARRYTDLLAGHPGVVTPTEAPDRTHVFHIYAVRVADRDSKLAKLGQRGIGCGIHYPVPIHLQEAYRGLNLGRGSFPVAEQCANEFLSLPMYPELSSDQVAYVAAELRELLDGEQ